jgi:hypothetical protein
MSRVTIVAIAVVALGAFFLLTRRGEPSPEERIRMVVNHAIDAAEAKDLEGVMDALSQGFTSGTASRDEIKGVLFVQLRRGAWRKVFLTSADIDVAPTATTAHVALEALLASGKSIESVADVLPSNAARYRFDLDFALEDDNAWRVVRGTYEQIPY